MTSTSKYSVDVENLSINDGGHSWDRPRTGDELKSFIDRHVAIVGELDDFEYETTL